MLDDAIVWMRILGVCASVAVIATWWPIGFTALRCPFRAQRIEHLGLGIMLVGIGALGIALYSYLLRAHDMIVLRDSVFALIVVFFHVVGQAYLAVAYYTRPGSNRLPAHKRGIWAAAVAFVFMMAVQIMF